MTESKQDRTGQDRTGQAAQGNTRHGRAGRQEDIIRQIGLV